MAAACTTITTSHCRPLCSAVCLFEQTGCEETKVNKEIMFWPSVVDALLHEADFSRKWTPWAKCLEKSSVFLCHLFNLKLFYMTLYGNIAIDKWRVFNVDSKRLCRQSRDERSPSDWSKLSTVELNCLINRSSSLRVQSFLFTTSRKTSRILSPLVTSVVCKIFTWKYSIIYDEGKGRCGQIDHDDYLFTDMNYHIKSNHVTKCFIKFNK